jgi:hypothetical protein
VKARLRVNYFHQLYTRLDQGSVGVRHDSAARLLRAYTADCSAQQVQVRDAVRAAHHALAAEGHRPNPPFSLGKPLLRETPSGLLSGSVTVPE